MYIAPEENSSEEVLMHIGEGDSASFRYVRTEGTFHCAVLEYSGRGNVRILLNRHVVGTADLPDEERTEVQLTEEVQSQEQAELTLVFIRPQGLVIRSITLF